MEQGKYCVYIHRNKINNKAYIGYTKMPAEQRWKNGAGYILQNFYKAIEKYGWDNFEHIVWAENLTESEAKKWEIRLIALFKTNCVKYRNPSYGYNFTDGGEGVSGFKLSKEQSEQRSKDRKGTRIGKDNVNSKSVLQYKLDGNLVREWESMHLVEMTLHIKITAISRVCNHIGNYRTAGGFIWRFSNDPLTQLEIDELCLNPLKAPKKAVPIIQYDKQGNIIKLWDNMQQASDALNISRGNIWSCVHGQRKTVSGFIFKEQVS